MIINKIPEIIEYQFQESPIGLVLLGQGELGCSWVSIVNRDQTSALCELHKQYPNSEIRESHTPLSTLSNHISSFLTNQPTDQQPVLHVKGTPFQLNVWEALRKIPYGTTYSYSDVTKLIGSKAHRAVGTAIGKNPVSILIPCHRVIRKNGETGHYRWGNMTKSRLLHFESATR